MNESTEMQVSSPTKIDRFRMEVLPPERRKELFAGMPPHVRPERFERNLVNAIMQNPELMTLEPRLVFREVSKAAALGLYLDPQLGEAYLIIGWNGKARQKEPQLRIGYRGLIKLARQSGEISMVYAHEVHKNDVFKASLGDHKALIHEPDVFGDRGDIVGYYAVVKYTDGETDFEPLTVAQAHSIRDRSDGYKAFAEGKIKSTPWSTDEVEMSKKTAIRRLTKRIPQSPELAEAIGIEDAAEHGDSRLTSSAQMAALTPPTPPAASISGPTDQGPPAPPSEQQSMPTPSSDQKEAAVSGPTETASGRQASDFGFSQDVTDIDPETGEIVDDGSPADFFYELETALMGATSIAGIAIAWDKSGVDEKFSSSPGEMDTALAIKARSVKKVKEAASQ